jgi:hypothetical protein
VEHTTHDYFPGAAFADKHFTLLGYPTCYDLINSACQF